MRPTIRRWRITAAAALAAVAVPLLALGDDTPPAAEPLPPITMTNLNVAPVVQLEVALDRLLFGPGLSNDVPGSEPALPLPALVGVISGGRNEGLALVKGSDGQTITLRPGASVDGWQLTSVQQGQATLERSGERQVIKLDFSNKSAATGADAPTELAPPNTSMSSPEI